MALFLVDQCGGGSGSSVEVGSSAAGEVVVFPSYGFADTCVILDPIIVEGC